MADEGYKGFAFTVHLQLTTINDLIDYAQRYSAGDVDQMTDFLITSMIRLLDAEGARDDGKETQGGEG